MKPLPEMVPAPAPGLDAESRASLRMFALQLTVLTVVSLGLGGRAPFETLVFVTALAGQYNSLAALFRGQRFGRGPLGQWDVAMLLFAVSLLLRLFR